MFATFDRQPCWYFPDNMHEPEPIPKNISMNNNSLDLIVKNHKICGYSWDYLNTVIIPISVNTLLLVDQDAYVSDIIGDAPTIDTPGRLNHKFYNTVDVKSWTCVDFDPDKEHYIWVQDSLLSFLTGGEKEINITPNMFGRKIVCVFKNFRYEEIKTFTYEDVNDADIVIDIDFSKQLLKGIYYLEVYIEDKTEKTLTNKYEIIVR